MPVDIFDIHQNIIEEYKSFVESFINIKDEKIREKIDQELKKGKLWPEPLIQFNPSYKRGNSVEELCREGVLHPEINNIFKEYDLYKHQVEALKLGTNDKDFIVTSGTGSGKSLTYLGTIFDYVLSNPGNKEVKAIIVYPMNALINSQFNEIHNLSNKYQEIASRPFPITFARYTGQEGEEIRKRIIEDKPDILLTNYMMMELIMTRNREESLRSSFKKSLKYLVFDELHTYRGRQGSDVAMQIRRIRSSCQKKLVCIGTSATMATGETLKAQREEVAKVGKTIFGRPFQESQIIDEEFELGFKELDEGTKSQKLIEALNSEIDSRGTSEELSSNALGAWLELEIGLQKKESKYVRRKPKTLSEITKNLSEITGISQEICRQQVQKLLKWAERINVENEKTGIRKKWLPYKLHQFISQTGSVHVTLKPPAKRDIESDIKLDASYYAMEDGDSVPLYPIVFSRMSGHEFLCVKRDEYDQRFEPRPFAEQTSEEDEELDLDSGYLLFDHDDPVWTEEDFAYLPDSWKKKNGELNKQSQDKIPERVWVDVQGNYSLVPKENYDEAWYIKSPLPFDPTSGAFFHGSTSEFTKLTKLGSEARSTATSIISQASIKALRTANYERGARKILSFTDVRQDASLQAGHFNDFTKTVRLRSAIYLSLKNAENQTLDHTTISQEVFKSLDLREEEYAREPVSESGFRSVVNKNEEALKKKLLYDLMYDLRYGWRVTLPNLEQCGLLRIRFQHLNDYCRQKEGWKDIPGFAEMHPEQRYEIVHNILDYFRKQYALSHESLHPNTIEKNEREIRNALNETWGFDENERIERANWMRFKPIQRKPSGFPTESIGYLSRLGRYLKDVQELKDYIYDKGSYEEVLGALLSALQGHYFTIDEIRDRGTGEMVPVYQLQADRIIWEPGDGKSIPSDPINNKSYKRISSDINIYFRDLYASPFHQDIFFTGAEHTGQISNEDRQERELKFRDGDLNALFCSPTMELGIDIADLNVVHMRNVPPNPANYSQRSGRSGRSGQAALVFTYCANYSPHDRHYFTHSRDMVAGQVLPPRMDMYNEELLLSHLNAICLSEVGLDDLNYSIAKVLDLYDEENLPLQEDIRIKFDLSVEKIQNIKVLFKDVIEDVREHLEWNSDEWLDEKIQDLYGRFDKSLHRWRSLFKDARAQLRRAQKILDDPTYKADSREKKLASLHENQARRQIVLLKNESAQTGLSEFYPYRYLASEGFLPGYNFTRLPIRAFMPSKSVSREGDYLSRPRYIALREFGPGNLVYHNGSTYSVTRMNVNDLASRITKAKVAKKSGYILDSEAFESEICPFTEDRLDSDSSREIITNLVHMGEVQTFPRQRISCNEEERRSRGYEIDTFFKVDGSLDRVNNVQLLGEESVLMTMRYIPAAQLYFVNRRWRTSVEKGFLINLTTGEWVRGNQPDRKNGSNGEEPQEHRPVQLFVRDTADAIYLHPTANLGVDHDGVVTLQYALKNAIEKVFQIEPNEIRVELMGEGDLPNILLYEASEGSLGVLKHLAEEPELFRTVVGKAYEICHFTKPTAVEKDLPPASYDDLLSYYNQYDHKVIDRRKIKSSLEILKDCRPEILHSGSNRNYREQYDYLLKSIDLNSKLEEDFVEYLVKEGLKLPDKAQYSPNEYYVEADFFYEPNVCIFIDGSVHDKPEVQTEDNRKRNVLRKAGYQVLVCRYDEGVENFIKRRPDIFKKVHIH